MWCDADAKYAVFDLPSKIFVSYTCGRHLTKTVDSISDNRLLIQKLGG